MSSYPTSFKRNEEKFQCAYALTKQLEKKLKKLLIQEKFNGLDYIRIYNLSFEDLKRIDFNNYSRIRVRKYYHSQETKNVLWIELRSIFGKKCTKTRFCIPENDLINFVKDKMKSFIMNAEEIIKIKKEKKVKPIVAIDYSRKAFNSKDKKVRVTIDTDLSYYAPPIKNKYFDKLLGKDKVAIIKIKYEKKLPKEIRELTKTLSNKPLSKLQRGLHFLEELK